MLKFSSLVMNVSHACREGKRHMDSLLNTPKRWIPNTAARITQTCNRSIIRPASKLLLHGLREHWSFDVRILGHLRCEFFVEIGSVASIDL
jgi:hypothetical protein